ncbi:MAG TPA: hypothetical protein VHL79_16275 [Ramlibacter sp.]|nr:hypothetical protein [Ramlibacter sp.]
MKFDVKVTHEAPCSRVMVSGEARLGRMLSLLQVLELDSRSWPLDRVLLDLRQHDTTLEPPEQERLLVEAARVLARMRKVAFLVPPGRMRECCGTRVFTSEQEALRWLAS